MAAKNQGKPFDEDFKRAAVMRLQAGESIKKIAEDLGVSDVSIYTWRKKMFPESARKNSRARIAKSNKTKIGRKQNKIHDIDFKKRIVARILAGERTPALAAEIGTHQSVVYSWKRKFQNSVQRSSRVNGVTAAPDTLDLQGIVHDAIIYLREVKKVVTADIRSGKRAEMDRGHLHALLALSELEKVTGK